MKRTVDILFWAFFLFLAISNGQEKRDSVSGNNGIRNQDKEILDDPCSYGIPFEKYATPVKQVRPELPDEHILRRKSVTIWVKAFVDSIGDVIAVRIFKSEAEILDETVLAAAKQWKFSPALMNGRPVGCWVTIPFKIGINEKRVDLQNQKEYKPVKPLTPKPEKKISKPKKKKPRMIQCRSCHGYSFR